MKLIKATSEHIDLLMTIRLEMLKEVNNLPADYAYDPAFVASVRQNFLEGDQTDVLCLDNGEPVACATLCYLSMMPTFGHPTGKRSHLMNVYVKKEYRRQGLARQMLNLLIEEAKARGVTEISLDATEAGRPLYKTLGFAENAEAMVMNL